MRKVYQFHSGFVIDSRTYSLATPSDLDGQVGIRPASEDVNHVAENITQIYAEYCHSIPQFVSLSPTPPADVDLSLAPVPFEEEAEAAKVEHALSKSQHGLALEESHFWAQLVEDDTLADSLARSAELLAAKSSVLSESYVRRTHPPTSQSYQDSKEILRAMGIPCVEPSGPFEAEALAASLVLSGHADFVASEDTVRKYSDPHYLYATDICTDRMC